MTTLGVMIAVYVVGLYVATLLDGLLSWSELLGGPNFFTVALWPLALVVLAMVFAIDAAIQMVDIAIPKVDIAIQKVGSLIWRPPEWFQRVRRAWFVLTLPFRPWTIGRMLKSKWRQEWKQR